MLNTKPEIIIGKIDYTNVWPIFHFFERQELGNSVKIISQVPTQLNAAMAKGEIDIGPISSFAYAEHFEKYLLFPDLSVSSYGKVNSIFLFHKKPLQELHKSKIALPTTSATSINLLKIILTRFYSAQPEYFYTSPILEDMLEVADAALLIGDDAIRAAWQPYLPYFVTDLGELWTRLTGKGMCFAVWAVRKQTVEENPTQVHRIFKAFELSKQHGLNHLEPIILAAQKRLGGDFDTWYEYFTQLCYDFGESEKSGLELYFQYALELGLLNQKIPLIVWTNKVE